MHKIGIIELPMSFQMGSVNCYPIETETGFVLIDTGPSNRRALLETFLARAGCRPGNLQLVVLTHGDFDHTGNAAYLAAKFGAPIAMHRADAGMAEQGDMFWNRASGSAFFRFLVPIFFRFPKSVRFTPDVFFEDGDDLAEYGLEAQVLSIPGHSLGSIGVLTEGANGGAKQAERALFCGDLLENVKQPSLNSIMDDVAIAERSVERVSGLGIDTVYPGHGQPFSMALFLAQYQQKRS
jgi:glyoxylase-like metal-dependent hydrolase (beta-lactamase superfamily II)